LSSQSSGYGMKRKPRQDNTVISIIWYCDYLYFLISCCWHWSLIVTYI
jgi:hypothetical protein